MRKSNLGCGKRRLDESSLGVTFGEKGVRGESSCKVEVKFPSATSHNTEQKDTTLCS
jgi:hypothetical protein